MALNTTIKNIQDIMRKDVGVDGDAQRIGQLSWMIFLKILDDHEKDIEAQDNSYCSPIPNHLRWRNWAISRELTGEDLVTFINNELFKGLKNLGPYEEKPSLPAVICSVFEDAYNYMRSGYLIKQVLDKINDDIHFTSIKDRHLFGDIYEKILKDLQSAGNAGEFYTPRAITEFIIDMIDPKLGEKILDPACGTGGFLTCSIDHVRNEYVKDVFDESILQQSIFGIEKKSLPHLLCITNMLLHGFNAPSNIRHDNALAKSLTLYGSKDQVDIIVTNPPFGGQEEDNIDSNFPENLRSRETADLFFLLIFTLLKNGGRAAIVLPDGFLFSEGVKTRIREKLLEECNLHTIIRLPKGVFSPYTGIKTNILFFTKGTPTKEIWYYEHPYPPTYKSYSKIKPIRREEFNREKQWWNTREENNHSWRVSIEEVRANKYNLDIKNPRNNAYNLNFDDLLVQYNHKLEEIETISFQLKQHLQSALKSSEDIVLDALFANFNIFTEAPKGIQKLK